MDFDYFSKKLLKKAAGQDPSALPPPQAVPPPINVQAEAEKLAEAKRKAAKQKTMTDRLKDMQPPRKR